MDIQSVKCEPDYEGVQPSIELIDLGPFLLGSIVKSEPNTVNKKRNSCTSYFDEANEATYRDPYVEKIKFGCRFCPITYQSKRQLVGHVRNIHQGDHNVDETIYERCCQPMDDSTFSCKACDEKLNFSYADFKRHVYTTHETKKTCLECPACLGFFASQQALHKHVVNRHSAAKASTKNDPLMMVKCESCLLEFKGSRALKSHQICKHRNEGLLKTAPLRKRADPPRECELCGKRMKNSNSLWAHKRTTHHIELDLPKLKTSLNHQCSQCSMTFKWSSNLSRHRRQVHEKVQYTCKFCKKSFGTRQTIYSHSFTHTKLSRYNCTEADCKFKTSMKYKYIEHLKDTHEVTEYNMTKHDPDRLKFSYKTLIDYCCISGSNKSDVESETDTECDSDEA